MLTNTLRYLLMIAVLLTSNSQALMAAQSLLTESGNNIEQVDDELPPCHQLADKAKPQIKLAEIQLECERDCNCCGGSCSSFAMTLDIPLTLTRPQLFESDRIFLFLPFPRAELLQRPPISA